LLIFLENAESSYTRHTILNSPIGKIVVEDNDQNISYSHSRSLLNDRNNKSKFSSAKRITIFDTVENDEIFNQGKYYKQVIVNIVVLVGRCNNCILLVTIVVFTQCNESFDLTVQSNKPHYLLS